MLARPNSESDRRCAELTRVTLLLGFICPITLADSRNAHLLSAQHAPQYATVRMRSSALYEYKTLVLRLWAEHIDDC